MKTFDEILETYFRESGYDLNHVQMRWVKLAVKEYGEQLIRRAAEEAEAEEGAVVQQGLTLYGAGVNKDSILKLLDEL